MVCFGNGDAPGQLAVRSHPTLSYKQTMHLRIAGFLLGVCSLAAGQATVASDAAAASDQASGSPVPLTCPAGAPIGPIKLLVRSPAAGQQPLPLERIVKVSEGDTILYAPVTRGRQVRHGEVALVLVPAKRDPAHPIIVTEPKSAAKGEEWPIDRSISIVAYVYGPDGLSKRRVQGFLSQDDLLISQLADYAEKTAQTEALIEALSDANSSAASVNAALSGFASQYGAASVIDKTQPVSVQAATLFSTINPQLASYDPLSSTTGARIGQTASLTTAAAALFFGSPIGLAAGGTAMLLDLRSIAFPGMQFRSSYAQEMHPGLNLCGQRTPLPPHTRVGYIWASRIPSAPLPKLITGAAHFAAEGQKSPIPFETDEKTWHFLDRARDWTLVAANGRRVPIHVAKLANQKSLELDLTKAKVEPGECTLQAFWDWVPFQSVGPVSVLPLSDFRGSKLEASSQDRLLAKAGKLAVTLEGADFEFTQKVQLKKEADEFATAETIPFVLPKGLRAGPQQHMDVQIDTAGLNAGDYQLLITQQDGKSHPVPIRILPNPPEIANLPILANQGATTQHYVLKGARLGLLSRLEAPGVRLRLDPAGADDSQRNVTVELDSTVQPGSAIPVSEFLSDRTEPVVIPDGLRITGPLPAIASSTVSLPATLPMTLNPGEIPADSTLSALLDVRNVSPRSILQLGCKDAGSAVSTMRLGEQTDKWSLQQLSQDQLFLSYDTTALPAGCTIQAELETPGSGDSQPYVLAHVVRLPAIDQFTPTGDQTADGRHAYDLTGHNLEMIDKAGWDQLTGADVSGLPVPLPGPGRKQSLRVYLPDPPSPSAPLYIWIRGDKSGRGTSIIAPNTVSAASTTTLTAKP